MKKKPMFSSLSAYVTGSLDPGLFVISGKLLPGVSIQEGDAAVKAVLDSFFKGVDEKEVEKVKNQAESTTVFAEVDLLNRAMGLAYAAFLGDIDLINTELDLIKSVTKDDILESAKSILREENSTTLYYLSDETEH